MTNSKPDSGNSVRHVDLQDVFGISKLQSWHKSPACPSKIVFCSGSNLRDDVRPEIVVALMSRGGCRLEQASCHRPGSYSLLSEYHLCSAAVVWLICRHNRRRCRYVHRGTHPSSEAHSALDWHFKGSRGQIAADTAVLIVSGRT